MQKKKNDVKITVNGEIMKFKSIKDLPSSVSDLSLVQKSKILNIANGLIASGHSPEISVEKASERVLSLNLKKSLNKETSVVNIQKDAEQMISYEVIYEPNTKDAHGEWMSPETIVKAKESYDKALAAGLVKENLFHLSETDAFTIEKTWIQEELDVVVIGTEQIIKAGTWVAKVKYNDPDLWNLKKANVVGGLSIQCSGRVDTATGEITDVDFGIECLGYLDETEEDDE